MSQQVLTLELPDDLYEHVRRAAKGMNQPLEEALVRIVQAATPSLDNVPAEYRFDLEALEVLSDQELWQQARKCLAPGKERQLEKLLRKLQQGALTNGERQTLAKLRDQADRLMLQRSYAYLLLKYRGHPIPNLAELGR